MKTMILAGNNAYPEFRKNALITSLEKRLPDFKDIKITANYIYLINHTSAFDHDNLAKICDLLDCRAHTVGNPDGVLIAPRPGTISPWSSRAGEVLCQAGIVGIIRMERAVNLRVMSDGKLCNLKDLTSVKDLLHDRMIEAVYESAAGFFEKKNPQRGREFDVLTRGQRAIEEANNELNLALSADEIIYLTEAYVKANRNPTDTELVMFGQVNSEHCRHKIFNASWKIDGEEQDKSLFQMIKYTHAAHPEGTMVAYRDNASVIEGAYADTLQCHPDNYIYAFEPDQMDIIMKVETHNHPTAISPFPGASTGVGGEIRDEVATGIGGRSKAGLCGLMVSNLRIPDFAMPWEQAAAEFPSKLATPLSIMIEGPKGGASYSNEHGRPLICGFFRTYEEVVDGKLRGYHKPIMLAGGMGNIRRCHVYKGEVKPGALVVQLGGPSMRIGLGGGAASSLGTDGHGEALDFDSVQRGNAEVQLRCQYVIEACVALRERNPIISIHDVGAGGLSNACPELIEHTGATFELRDVPTADPSLSPMEIWCCEAQERYVLVIAPENRELFESICRRERCPVAFIGVARDDRQLILNDALFKNQPINMAIDVLLGKPPRMLRDVVRAAPSLPTLAIDEVDPAEALQRILQLPAVASKKFLITTTDRTVTGLVHRDQLVGRYQLPVADQAVTATSFTGFTGEAMSMGERTPVAVVNAPASGRLAIGEALMNIASAHVGSLEKIKLSANWMCACGEGNEDAALFDTVRSVAIDLCPKLGVSIPVGKDSLSMRTVWTDSNGKSHRQFAPLSLIISAFAPITDIRLTVTPDFEEVDSRILLIDLGKGRNRLAGSALTQVYNQVGSETPDLDDPELLKNFFKAIQLLIERKLVCAYHDRSDGGVAVSLIEMAMAGGVGIDINLPAGGSNALAALFAEELGAVVQIEAQNTHDVLAVFKQFGLAHIVHDIGAIATDRFCTIKVNGKKIIRNDISTLCKQWSELSARMKALRDHPSCAQEEYEGLLDPHDPGLNFKADYDFGEIVSPITISERPRVALLREQGVAGPHEMAAALTLAGFEAVDVHMSDLLHGKKLCGFKGLIACGNFSYGDVFGAAAGWATAILSNVKLMSQFEEFFKREDAFALGVNNGCQLFSRIRKLIPGSELWPKFGRNKSDQHEARLVTVEVMNSPSLLLRGMSGARIPAIVSHGEGMACFDKQGDSRVLTESGLGALRYVDNHGKYTARYPFNPDGSEEGLAGFTNKDGRVTIMMSHPERAIRAVQISYLPEDGVFAGDTGPWFRLFKNAYCFATGR